VVCGLSKVWNGGGGYVLQGMWLVLLESTKGQFLGVDPLEQPVPPRVQYRMTSLLISDDMGSVVSSVAWGRAQCLT
jgi:hypothetical protein